MNGFTSGKGPPPFLPPKPPSSSRWNSSRPSAPIASTSSAGPNTSTSHHKAEDAQPNESAVSSRARAPPQLLTNTASNQSAPDPSKRAPVTSQQRNSKLFIQKPRSIHGRPPTTAGGWDDAPRRPRAMPYNDRRDYTGKGKGRETHREDQGAFSYLVLDRFGCKRKGPEN